MIVEQQRHDPDKAKVLFHELIEEPKVGNPAYFSLKCTKIVRFGMAAKVKKEEGDNKWTQFTLGCHPELPLDVWKGPRMACFWLMKFNPTKGFVPVKPCVALTEQVTLGGSKALQLNSTGS